MLVFGPVFGQMGGGDERFDGEKGRLFSRRGEKLEPSLKVGEQNLQDFTLALAVEGALAAVEKETVLAAWPGQGEESGSLRAQTDGAVVFRLLVGETTYEIRTGPGALTAAGANLTLAVSIRRDPRQALAGIWINGVEHASAAIPPGAVPFDPAQFQAASELAKGASWRQVDVYSRALARWEVLDWGLLAGAMKAPTQASNAGALVVLGGSEAVAVMEEGTLEALFVSQQESPPGTTPRVRSLAWEGDTVFARDRPMNFGSLRQQLQRSEAGVALLMFGRQECLELGQEGVAAFKEALTELVKECREVVPEVWLAGLSPFEKKSPPLPDLSLRNDELAAYDTAIREVAAAQQTAFIDLRVVWPAKVAAFTTDGVNLSQSGARLTGRLLLSAEESPELEQLRSLARAKNRLWNHYWRPTNWAFLHGDRTAQPSSRDHRDPRLRWFPAETEAYWRLIEEKENELVQAAMEKRRKLP